MPTARRSALQPILDRNLLTRLLHRRGRAQLPGCNLGVLPEDGIDLSQWVSVHGEPSKPRDQLSLDLHTLTKRGLISSTTFLKYPKLLEFQRCLDASVVTALLQICAEAQLACILDNARKIR